VEASPVYELLLSLFVWGSKKDLKDLECGSTFFEQLETDTTPEVAEQLTGLHDCGELWLPLVGVARESGATKSVEAFVKHLSAMDPVNLRTHLIRSCHKGDMSRDEVAAAAAGEPGALARLTEQKHATEGFMSVMSEDPTMTQRRIVTTLSGVQEVLGASISELLPALRRDAAEKRAIGGSMDAPAFVETATNGVTFRMQPQITDVVLIPSKIIRPWTVIADHKGTQIFAYSVADEHLHADPEAPPSYLVDLYKALGDEKRLRILSILSEGDTGLMEIAERVDVAKSTAHHHLRVLRSAGLVRAIVSDNKEYGLRRKQIPEVGRLLDMYLTTPAQAAADAPAAETKRN
jgi:DNA-binding transcriptional ArsR family regulator